jgi:hypothetical protein
MLAKRPEIERRLEAAREQLAAAEAARDAIAASEPEAIGTAEAHAAWRAKRDNANGEVERLGKVLRAIEEEVENVNLAEAEANLRRRHAEKLKLNTALAKRTQADIARANAILLPLLRDVAASTAEDQAISAALSKLELDLEPVVPAELLARGKPALPRKQIAQERVWLWTKASDRFLIGDQDSVEDRGGGKGMLKAGMSIFPCIKSLFEKVTYHPAKRPEQPVPLWHMKLPASDGPGFVFDGSRFTDPRAVIAALDQATKAETGRPVEIELRPIPKISEAADANVSVDGAR